MGRARVGQGGHRGGGVRSGLRARPASGPLPPLHPSLCAVRTQGPPSPPQPLCLGLRHHLPGSPSSLCLLSPRLSSGPCAILPRLHPPRLRVLTTAPNPSSPCLRQHPFLLPSLVQAPFLPCSLQRSPTQVLLTLFSVPLPFNIHFIYTLPSSPASRP